MNKNTIILDCDTGEDDALAILVAIANKLPLKYVVTSYGNTTVTNSTQNSSRLLSLAGKKNIKVIKGSSTSLYKHPLEKHYSADDFVGKNGICNVKLSPSKFKNVKKFTEKKFANELADILKKEAPVDYIITGPCTNFAKVCLFLGEDIKKYVKRLFIMGGSLYTPGNTGPINPETQKPFAEFNFYGDAEAVDVVLKSGIPIYLVSWDTTSTVTIPRKDIDNFSNNTHVSKFAKKLMLNFFDYYGLSHNRNFELNDPLTVLALLQYGSFKKTSIKIIKEGLEYGRTITDKNGYKINLFQLNQKQKKEAIKKVLSDLHLKS